MVKYKTFRLNEISAIDQTLNNFSLGEIIDFHLAAPDYRIIILVVRYEDDPVVDEPKEPEAKNDKSPK